MTRAEAAAMATMARAVKARSRRASLIAAMEAGNGMKRAAYIAGVSVRTARRYRAEAR